MRPYGAGARRPAAGLSGGVRARGGRPRSGPGRPFRPPAGRPARVWRRVRGSAGGGGWRSGRSRAFDSSADGFVRSEGCVMVFLKRLEDARRDGDRVLAVIRGTATNQDGRTGTITKPSRDAQVLVYRAALRNAGVDPDTVGMVEAYGTGTPVGDPIEFSGLAEVYGLADATRCALAIATGRHDNLSGRYITTGEAGSGSRLPGPALHLKGHAS
ncbi:polyketide synthase [Streptomyces sp. OUCMDZ-4982]|uniref:beta-ketoacyl [acyl carrier protein] synthase domain-containing protein n=1 Tax=Streptomyces sp. OUCMDZ-4982 TaxID=2973090 RepID=UPI002852D4C6|nr:polyketide synthase [Streptomyces sp. OUCMDZ-4982]